MRWFRRGGDDAEPPRDDGPRDDGLPTMSVARAARFTAAAQQAFRELGLETVARGDGALLAADGLVVNLRTIAHTAATLPEHRWRRFLALHARTLVAARSTSAPESLDDVRDSLHLRLFDRAALMPDATGVPVAGDLFAIAVLDHPDHIQGVTDPAAIERLGGWAAVRDTGLANLRRLTTDETTELPHAVHVSRGGWYQASRLLVLDSLLAADLRLERPAHGVLVAVPNRHLLLVHPLGAAPLVDAVRTMAGVAQGESRGPGGLSGALFYGHDGVVEQVTREDGDRTVVVADGRFGAVVRGLGLH